MNNRITHTGIQLQVPVSKKDREARLAAVARRNKKLDDQAKFAARLNALRAKNGLPPL
jgi:hypothetical protein